MYNNLTSSSLVSIKGTTKYLSILKIERDNVYLSSGEVLNIKELTIRYPILSINLEKDKIVTLEFPSIKTRLNYIKDEFKSLRKERNDYLVASKENAYNKKLEFEHARLAFAIKNNFKVFKGNLYRMSFVEKDNTKILA